MVTKFNAYIYKSSEEKAWSMILTPSGRTLIEKSKEECKYHKVREYDQEIP